MELGAALARAEMDLLRHVVAVGTIVHESVFYFHPRVRRVATVREWLAEVESHAAGPSAVIGCFELHSLRRVRTWSRSPCERDGILASRKKTVACEVAPGMTTLVDRAVAALRANHDTLAALVPTLSEEQLKRPSGATEWTVAQTLSHLGSGAEISRKPIATAAGEQVEAEDNQSIWARWNTSSPAEQAAEFVKHDVAYLGTVEALSAEQRDSLMIDLGFLPQPVPLVVALGMRLNEVANHAWDVRVGVDPSATVDPESAELLVELFGGPLAFLLDFSGKADQVEQEVRLAIPGGGIEITGAVIVTGEVGDPTATFEGPAEAVVRLLSGRLGAKHAAGVSVTGNVTLDELRKVFPGY